MNNNKKKGFASMSPERRKEIASKGGKASPSNFKHDPKRASEAGKKGGMAQSIEDKRKGGRNSRRNYTAL